jgi:hypothetical protein
MPATQLDTRRGLQARPPPGTVVRLTGYFLKATGQFAGGEGTKRWKVQPCNCGLCRLSAQIFVAVDEPAAQDDAEPADPSPRWRHIAGWNLQIVGIPPRAADLP